MTSTALHAAAGENDVEKLLRVLEANASLIDSTNDLAVGVRLIDRTSCSGRTPMHEAASLGSIAAIEALVWLGCRTLDAPSRDGQTPLCTATKKNQGAAIEALVRSGNLALDTPDRGGKLPLDHALMAQQRKRDCTVTLRMLGAGSTIPESSIPAPKRQLATLPLDEEAVAELRFRVYFAHSLTRRLLVALQRVSEHPIQTSKSFLRCGSSATSPPMNEATERTLR